LVEVVEREPRAVVAVQGLETPFAVDAEGRPFAPATAEELDSLPRLRTGAPVAADQPDPRLADAVRLAERLPELGLAAPIEVRLMERDDAAGFGLLLAGLRPELLLAADAIDAGLARFVGLVGANVREWWHAHQVDLRYEDQAVLRWQPLPVGAAQAASRRGSAGPSNSRPSG
jgi:cell division septal protein FtsQ